MSDLTGTKEPSSNQDHAMRHVFASRLLAPSRLAGLVCVALLAACATDDGDGGTDDGKTYGIFTVVSDTEAEVRGDLSDGVLAKFEAMMSDHPGITQVTLVYVGGSSVSGTEVGGVPTDDGLELGRAIYKRKMRTFLPDGGLVASGGTDLLASGSEVSYAGTLGGVDKCDEDPHTGTCIGVHAWAGGWDGNDNGTGWDIKDDKDHPAHAKYLAYYKDIGVDEAFYWYTLNAAKSEGMAYMTDADFKSFLGR